MKGDLVLEGARREEFDVLRRIMSGEALGNDPRVEPLQSKGWVDVWNGTALLTLAGRTLIDRHHV